MNFLELSIYIDMYSNIWIKCFIICNRIRNLLELFWLYIAQRTFMYMWIVLFNTNMLVSWFFFFLFKKIGVFERSKGISAVPVNSIPCFCLMKSYFKWTLRVWLFFFFFDCGVWAGGYCSFPTRDQNQAENKIPGMFLILKSLV